MKGAKNRIQMAVSARAIVSRHVDDRTRGGHETRQGRHLCPSRELAKEGLIDSPRRGTFLTSLDRIERLLDLLTFNE